MKMSDFMKEEEARWERDKHWLMGQKNLAFMEKWCKESRESEEKMDEARDELFDHFANL